MRLAAQAVVVDSRWEAERLTTGVRVREEEEREAEEERQGEAEERYEEAEDHLRC